MTQMLACARGIGDDDGKIGGTPVLRPTGLAAVLAAALDGHIRSPPRLPSLVVS